MRTVFLARALILLAAVPALAQTTPVPVVEPGKPMRFQAAAPAPAAAAAPPGAEPCDLEMPQDRRVSSSTACMRCHDGSKAVNAAYGHRFDIEYVVQGKDLRPNPEQYNPAVVLGGSKVTCMSCHVPLSTAPMRLAAPTGGALEQRLCTACHIR